MLCSCPGKSAFGTAALLSLYYSPTPFREAGAWGSLLCWGWREGGCARPRADVGGVARGIACSSGTLLGLGW